MLALGIITRTACGGVMSLQVNAVAYARVGVFVRVCLYICERVCKSVMNIRLYVFVCLCFGGLMCWCEDGVFAVYVCGVRVCECMSVSVCLCCCCSCCCVCVCVLLGASMRKSESMYLCVCWDPLLPLSLSLSLTPTLSVTLAPTFTLTFNLVFMCAHCTPTNTQAAPHTHTAHMCLYLCLHVRAMCVCESVRSGRSRACVCLILCMLRVRVCAVNRL